MLKFKYFISREFFITLIILGVIGLLVYLAVFFWFLPSYTRHGERLVVPSVYQLSEAEAIRKLESVGLRPLISDSAYNSDLKPGEVLAQYPKEHSRVKPNRTVSLTINQRTAPMVLVPNLIDMSLYQAKQKLESWKLGLGKVTRVPDIANNTILKMNYDNKPLRPGTRIPEGSKVDVHVSDNQGTAKVELPNLVGRTHKEALNIVRDLGLGLGGINYNPNSPPEKLGSIYAQSPSVEKTDSIRVGQPIDIYIYGEEPEENEGILTEEINQDGN